MDTPQEQAGGTVDRSPSLRRVLTGYLRLRSPYNLCVDAAILVLLSYVGGSLERWARFTEVARRGPTQQVSMWWAASEAMAIATGMVYYIGAGIFFVGCARIIADRIGERRG
jgi:hypothetical protein